MTKERGDAECFMISCTECLRVDPLGLRMAEMSRVAAENYLPQSKKNFILSSIHLQNQNYAPCKITVWINFSLLTSIINRRVYPSTLCNACGWATNFIKAGATPSIHEMVCAAKSGRLRQMARKELEFF